MASYHLSVKTGGKGSASPHADYIAREGKYARDKDSVFGGCITLSTVAMLGFLKCSEWKLSGRRKRLLLIYQHVTENLASKLI